MFVLSNIIVSVADVSDAIIKVYSFFVIVGALLSWFSPDPHNPVVRTLRMLTEPVFYRVRKWMPFVYMRGLDLSPVVVLLILQLFSGIVVRSVRMFGLTL